ncbi:hypothetical protein EJ04DRAFT_524920 [Polyplosphaeria fusca]|uniref:Uncharacterized protein n=1 Tax=Polyplosphaeria fusca TaxID=682080 RepID=A0A9P4QX94_9PLEO|nr:hypothetical protein EJ04DRAFT_524920 [Polyplosphaeria fusca]
MVTYGPQWIKNPHTGKPQKVVNFIVAESIRLESLIPPSTLRDKSMEEVREHIFKISGWKDEPIGKPKQKKTRVASKKKKTAVKLKKVAGKAGQQKASFKDATPRATDDAGPHKASSKGATPQVAGDSGLQQASSKDATPPAFNDNPEVARTARMESSHDPAPDRFHGLILSQR